MNQAIRNFWTNIFLSKKCDEYWIYIYKCLANIYKCLWSNNSLIIYNYYCKNIKKFKVKILFF